MLQLANETPFAPAMAVFPDEKGIDTLYIVLKATFELGERVQIAEEQVPVTLEDEYSGEPGASSLVHASEMHLSKPTTDAVLVGRAWAPGGRQVPRLDVTFAVAERKKTVRVTGDRKWRRGLLGLSTSPPKPFESMPLVYERAFGGQHALGRSGKMLAEERNPVGTGFRGKRKKKELAGQLLPNLEDPRRPLRKPGERCAPAGFGFVSPSWMPRRAFAGTYDEAWSKTRAPYLPTDFDPRFFNAAHPDLVFDRHLEGGEPVRVENASQRGPLRFDLPRCELEATILVDGRREHSPMKLETVLVEPDEDRLCMTWRAGLPCDKSVLRIERVTLSARSLGIGGRPS